MSSGLFSTVVDLIFFTSPIGLGHAARDIAILQNLDSVSKKIVSGIGAAQLISEYGFDVEDVYQPPPFQVLEGKLQKPLRWLFKYYSFYRKCKTFSSEIIKKNEPRLIASDEDFASLVIAQNLGIKTILVTDILKTKFTTGLGSIIERIMNREMEKIIKRCDLVIVPEEGQDSGNIVRIGPIVRETHHSRQELRNKFGFDKKTIVLSPGGTNSGKFLVERTIQDFRKTGLDADLVIVSGPTLKLEEQSIRNLGFVKNLHEVIYAADLVISLAGKSTIDESRHYGTPGIFIPIKGHFEQEDNAREIGYAPEDIFRLDELIIEKINQSREPTPYLGASKASELIRNLL